MLAMTGEIYLIIKEDIPYYRGLHLLLDMMTKNGVAIPG